MGQAAFLQSLSCTLVGRIEYIQSRDQKLRYKFIGAKLSFRAVFTWLSKGIGFGFGFGFTTPFGWLVYLLWFWFYDSQVKTALTKEKGLTPIGLV